MLSASNLGKRFGRRWLFRGLEFELERRDRLAVIGRNGAGKSTLLKVLAGLIPPSEGKIRNTGDDPRRSIGYAALDMALYPALTVGEHLELTAELRECESRTEELLEEVGLLYAIRQPTSELSTGMRARLKLAIAVQSLPTVLLLDEPGAGLDEAGRQVVERLIEQQSMRGAVVIATNDPLERRFATHEMEILG
ncbi:MAG: hypothetical protein BGO01_01085 [Armatimonadetes bacterium 55-13]|nr:ATP-binding cassette domain-containing protein [Armatimonadota bacterium]OJU65547.1 MAG: hypothetical protein BGO01_01085 [Armatimonadetes bacterium 55-13]